MAIIGRMTCQVSNRLVDHQSARKQRLLRARTDALKPEFRLGYHPHHGYPVIFVTTGPILLSRASYFYCLTDLLGSPKFLGGRRRKI